jgi:signal transduction histidine kinase
MAGMKKLLNYFLWRIIIYSGIILAFSIPVYYFVIRRLWEYELNEHHILLTPEAGREDSYLIIEAVVLVSAVFFILLLGGLILLNRRLAGRMWKPFYETMDRIRAFDLAKSEPVKLERSGIAEFDELTATLERLLAGNAAVFKQQREFADNASHELQTPLAIVQSQLELLAQAGNLQDDQYRNIETAMAAISRASRINRNLLLLTKIENSQFNEKEKIHLGAMITGVLEQFSLFFEQKELVVNREIDSDVIVYGNPVLTEILVGNLLTNAIRYSRAGETISVKLTKAEMVIENPGDHSLKEDQLFRRFAKASPVKAGVGLGLAIVHQVCERQQWNVSYAWLDQRHIFRVRFGRTDKTEQLL